MSLMPKFPRLRELNDGWTKWVRPKPVYMLACCDCGLVHNLQFDVTSRGRVVFRAQRNPTETEALRARQNIKVTKSYD
jgi:hypothetical protein